jgi:tRNA (mo5U34)-methyltransferase
MSAELTDVHADLTAQVNDHDLWYHTIELAPGVVTPGWFDLRRVLRKLPWPEVEGLRCLDVATYDGCLAFELERRGAAEVIATDVASHADWDWLPRERDHGVAFLDAIAGRKGRGFEIAAAALGSKVRREFVSVYDLSPEVHGTFDVVVCGALLLHLRDPFRALNAIRGVCNGRFLSIEQVDFLLTLTRRRLPAFDLVAKDGQWLVPNVAGHRRMLEIAGFEIERAIRPFAEPFGASHPAVPSGLGARIKRRVLGSDGMPSSAVLCGVAPLQR